MGSHNKLIMVRGPFSTAIIVRLELLTKLVKVKESHLVIANFIKLRLIASHDLGGGRSSSPLRNWHGMVPVISNKNLKESSPGC